MPVSGLDRRRSENPGGILLHASAPRPSRARKSSGGSDRSGPRAHQVPVAYLIDHGAALGDIAGPIEAFDCAPQFGTSGFFNFTVAADRNARVMQGGVEIVPQYGFGDAPSARVLFIPGQGDWSAKKIDWICAMHAQADVVIAVRAGAFLLAEAGLLDGLQAATHPSLHERFAERYPSVELLRDEAIAECGKIITAAGITAAIDAAVRTIGRYYGAASANDIADFL